MDIEKIEFDPKFEDDNSEKNQKIDQSMNTQNNQSFVFDKYQLEIETNQGIKSSNFQSSVNMLKSLIGIGILGLSYGFMQGGVILSTVVIIITYALCYYTTTLLVDVQKQYQNKKNDEQNFSWQMILGRKSLYFYQLNNIILQLGCCVSYVIFFIKFFEIALDLENTIGNRFIFLLLSLVVIGPMTLISNYSKFYKWSQIGNILSLSTIIFVTIYNMNRIKYVQIEMNYADFSNLGQLFGTAIFSFEIINQIPYIQHSMKTPNDFTKTLKRVIIFYGFFMILFCIFDSIAQQKSLQEHKVSLIGMQDENKYLIILQCFYAISLTISYPIQLYPIVQIIEESEFYKKYYRFKYHYRFALTFLIFFIAFLVPDFSSFLNLVGSLAGISLQFGFPIVIYHNTFKDKAPKSKLQFNAIILITVIIFGIISLQKSIQNLSQESV